MIKIGHLSLIKITIFSYKNIKLNAYFNKNKLIIKKNKLFKIKIIKWYL